MGVLLHAGLLVRHSLTMVDAAKAYHALLTDLAGLCRTSHDDGAVPVSDLPSLPQPSDPAGCPVCAGLAGAFAVLGPQAVLLRAEPAAESRLPGIASAAPRSRRTAHPPARGPPVGT
jgi:hypothetical protein